MSLKSELEEQIARVLLEEASKLGPQAVRAIKRLGLTKAGKGLPEAVAGRLEEDLKATISSLIVADSSGSASWDSAGNSGFKVPFILASKLSDLVAKRNAKNWAKFARTTDRGTRIVDAFQKDATYNAAVTAAVPKLVDAYTHLVAGDYLPSPSNDEYGVVLLTGVVTTGVARSGTPKFSAKPIVFYLWGARALVRKDYKKAKQQAKSLLGRLKAPSWGPFLDP